MVLFIHKLNSKMKHSIVLTTMQLAQQTKVEETKNLTEIKKTQIIGNKNQIEGGVKFYKPQRSILKH